MTTDDSVTTFLRKTDRLRVCSFFGFSHLVFLLLRAHGFTAVVLARARCREGSPWWNFWW